MWPCPTHSPTEALRTKGGSIPASGAIGAVGSSGCLSPAAPLPTRSHIGLITASREGSVSSTDHIPAGKLDVAAFVGTFALVPREVPGGPSLPPQPALPQWPPSSHVAWSVPRRVLCRWAKGLEHEASSLTSGAWQGLCAPPHPCPWSHAIPAVTPAQACARGTCTYTTAHSRHRPTWVCMTLSTRVHA